MSTATPDRRGYFGEFGGRYVPETLMGALEELEVAFRQTMDDPPFRREFDRLLRDFVGRPTPLHDARRLALPPQAGSEKEPAERTGARILLKREDLAHTGAHKINNALGQVLLAERMNKRRIIAETGAGQHGVATATAAALLGLECIVYMGAEDVRRQQPNVQRMNLLGAEVRAVDAGSRTLKDAINEAIRDWVTHIGTTHYVIGSAVGPHPYPLIVRELQSVIGRESRAQVLERIGGLPDLIVACVGGGSNAIGMFHPFLDDDVPMLGVEAGGEGLEGTRHAAPLCAGRVGVLHGARSFLMQDSEGQVSETHSVSAGLDYPGVGPEHSQLKASGRVEYTSCTDSEALEGFDALCALEGIVPALESAHAIAIGRQRAAGMSKDATVLINLSGRGDKDLALVEEVRR